MDMRVIEQSGCAVLAGGAGKRMGKLNKAELNIGGHSFLTGICSEMEKAGFRGYISVANYDQKAPEGWMLVKDSVTGSEGEYIGPIGGIYSCLKQAEKDGLKGLFFVPCDAPNFRENVVETLKDITVDYNAASGYNAVLFRTKDGRVQTTFGWYSTDCLEMIKDEIDAEHYKVIKVCEEIKTLIVGAADYGITDDAFLNINSAEDYAELNENKHVVITGDKNAGKTTLVERILDELSVPIYGYQTVKMDESRDGPSETYMYPAGRVDYVKRKENYIGLSGERVLDVSVDTFNKLGTSLIKTAGQNGIIVMDEIGFMEKDAAVFRRAVINAFGGSIPVLATTKSDDRGSEYIRMIKNHPNAELFKLSKDNREEVFKEVMEVVSAWDKHSEKLKGIEHEEL